MTLSKLEDSPSLSERAYQTIREAILSLKFKPGQYISIKELSNQLGVSRTPVRDALLSLEKDDLVSIVPYKGAYVSVISARDIEEIMELRILLECYAVKKAAPLLSEEDFARAAAILRSAEKAHNEGKYAEAADIGHLLHELILNKVQNSRFNRIIEWLDTHYERIRRHSTELRGGRSRRSMDQHRHLLKVLKLANAEAAEAVMAEHLSSVRDDVLSSLPLSSTNTHQDSGITGNS